jgi:N-dimethylarginine dimethylaminohydrolase
MLKTWPKARFLMCRPEHFEVAYAINPWMDPKRWASRRRALTAASKMEWMRLYHTLLELGAQVELVPAAAGVPDLVFTANAAVVLNGKALLARFRHPERQAEEPHFESMFRTLQYRGQIDSVHKLPEGVMLEGAGDCVWDDTRNMFWMGYGPRSDLAARDIVAAEFGMQATALELADPRFYHMDTALCPLPGGELIYFPEAFAPAGQAAIRDRVAARDRIEIAADDAEKLAANAVAIDDNVVVSDCSDRLRRTLAERGYRVRTTPLTSFLRSGGSAFCLALRLDRRSAAMHMNVAETAA